jgi:hypothetical protein
MQCTGRYKYCDVLQWERLCIPYKFVTYALGPLGFKGDKPLLAERNENLDNTVFMPGMLQTMLHATD